ncbi:MAG TPA: hypothetical protein VJ953_15840 [Saprospiraceae bacterium]|nr:hypothetical protein [Saprospiraceae bacterium]
MIKYHFFFWSMLLLGLSCQSAKSSYQRIAADLSLIEQSEFNDFSSAERLQAALYSVDSLIQVADDLLPKEDPRRLEHPFSPILNRLYQYRAFLQTYQSDASLYNIGGHLQIELTRGKGPKSEKINRCQAILRKAPEYYQAAKTKLAQADTSKLRLAIRKQIRSLEFLNKTYTDSLQHLNQDQEEDVQHCRYAIKDYIAWCNSQLIEQSQ